MRNIFRSLPGLLFVALIAGSVPALAGESVYPLPSGKLIPVLSAGRVDYAQGQVALMLRYETELSLDDKSALEAEVDEIWNSFHTDVDKAELSIGIVSANEKPHGFFSKTSRVQTFVFKKGTDGVWVKAQAAARP